MSVGMHGLTCHVHEMLRVNARAEAQVMLCMRLEVIAVTCGDDDSVCLHCLLARPYLERSSGEINLVDRLRKDLGSKPLALRPDRIDEYGCKRSAQPII